jgi:hypothetical protein
MRARFDKHGRPLPETGHGCGCQQCASAGAPRYERRQEPVRASRWGPLRRRLMTVLRSVSMAA